MNTREPFEQISSFNKLLSNNIKRSTECMLSSAADMQTTAAKYIKEMSNPGNMRHPEELTGAMSEWSTKCMMHSQKSLNAAMENLADFSKWAEGCYQEITPTAKKSAEK